MEVRLFSRPPPPRKVDIYQFVSEKLAKLEVKRRPKLRTADQCFFFVVVVPGELNDTIQRL